MLSRITFYGAKNAFICMLVLMAYQGHLGGVQAMRVVERSASFITSIAICFQMIILMVALATGGRAFNRYFLDVLALCLIGL